MNGEATDEQQETSEKQAASSIHQTLFVEPSLFGDQRAGEMQVLLFKSTFCLKMVQPYKDSTNWIYMNEKNNTLLHYWI